MPDTFTFSLRPYEPDDWEVVCQIHDQARPIELEGSCDPRAFIPLAEDKEDLVDFNESTKYVAVHADQVVGFSGVKDDVITWMYVRPDLFGRGIGKQLLLTALEHVQGDAFTFALPGNSRALALYKHLGFDVHSEFDSDCDGYPCKCLKLVKRAASQ